ncbi:MAG: hypothetical protein SOU19_07620 [Candidatus Caccosoma sp.]|nr:hypothetical protein [Candidatus Caccosoma sp.]
MKYRNKVMLIVLLIICIAFSAYKYVPALSSFVNKLYDGKYNAILLPLAIVALITIIGILVINSDKAKIVTEDVIQSLQYNKESNTIIVNENKKGEHKDEER